MGKRKGGNKGKSSGKADKASTDDNQSSKSTNASASVSPSASTTRDIMSFDGSTQPPTPPRSSVSSLSAFFGSGLRYGGSTEKRDSVISHDESAPKLRTTSSTQRRSNWRLSPSTWWPCRVCNWTCRLFRACYRVLVLHSWRDPLLTLGLLIVFLYACWYAMDLVLNLVPMVSAQDTECSVVYVTLPGPILTVSLIDAPPSSTGFESTIQLSTLVTRTSTVVSTPSSLPLPTPPSGPLPSVSGPIVTSSGLSVSMTVPTTPPLGTASSTLSMPSQPPLSSSQRVSGQPPSPSPPLSSFSSQTSILLPPVVVTSVQPGTTGLLTTIMTVSRDPSISRSFEPPPTVGPSPPHGLPSISGAPSGTQLSSFQPIPSLPSQLSTIPSSIVQPSLPRSSLSVGSTSRGVTTIPPGVSSAPSSSPVPGPSLSLPSRSPVSTFTRSVGMPSLTRSEQFSVSLPSPPSVSGVPSLSVSPSSLPLSSSEGLTIRTSISIPSLSSSSVTMPLPTPSSFSRQPPIPSSSNTRSGLRPSVSISSPYSSLASVSLSFSINPSSPIMSTPGSPASSVTSSSPLVPPSISATMPSISIPNPSGVSPTMTSSLSLTSESSTGASSVPSSVSPSSIFAPTLSSVQPPSSSRGSSSSWSSEATLPATSSGRSLSLSASSEMPTSAGTVSTTSSSSSIPMSTSLMAPSSVPTSSTSTSPPVSLSASLSPPILPSSMWLNTTSSYNFSSSSTSSSSSMSLLPGTTASSAASFSSEQTPVFSGTPCSGTESSSGCLLTPRDVTTRILSYGNTAFSFVFPTPSISTTVSYWTGTYPTVTGPEQTTLPLTTRTERRTPQSELPSFELLGPTRSRVETVATEVVSGQAVHTETRVVAAADPPGCGEYGNFTLTFDDSVVGPDNGDILPVNGMNNPYHHLFYANGYTYVPDKWEPYPAQSQPNVAMFLPLAGALLPNTAFAGTLLPGEIGAGPRASVSAYWFNAYSAFFGCALNGLTPCTLRISGYRYDATVGEEVLVAEQNATLAACWGYINCRLTQVVFDERFRGLSGIQFNAYTSNLGIEQMFMMDTLAMEWFNNTCAAGILRIGHR